MNWFYESGGQQQGPVSESDLDELLSKGEVTPETRVWHEGMADWQPLRHARQSNPPPLPSPGAPPLPGDDSPLEPGFVRCHLTGEAIPESEAIYIQGKPYSADAKLRVLQTIQQGRPLPELGPERTGPAWEQRKTLGVFAALLQTVKGVLLAPRATFANMKREGGIGNPMLFSVIMGCAGIALDIIYNLIAVQILGEEFFAEEQSTFGSFLRTLTLGEPASFAEHIAWVAFSPIIIILSDFLYAGLTHLALQLFGGTRRPFETTLRTNFYASGASSALSLLPGVGTLLSIPWFLIVICIGLAQAHDISVRKACLAALIPLMLCGGLIVALLGGAAAISQMSSGL